MSSVCAFVDQSFSLRAFFQPAGNEYYSLFNLLKKNTTHHHIHLLSSFPSTVSNVSSFLQQCAFLQSSPDIEITDNIGKNHR